MMTITTTTGTITARSDSLWVQEVPTWPDPPWPLHRVEGHPGEEHHHLLCHLIPSDHHGNVLSSDLCCFWTSIGFLGFSVFCSKNIGGGSSWTQKPPISLSGLYKFAPWYLYIKKKQRKRERVISVSSWAIFRHCVKSLVREWSLPQLAWPCDSNEGVHCKCFDA